MEIPVLVQSLKSSSIFSSTSFQRDKTFWGVVSAAVEQSRRKANMVPQGDRKFGPSGPNPKKPQKNLSGIEYKIIIKFNLKIGKSQIYESFILRNRTIPISLKVAVILSPSFSSFPVHESNTVHSINTHLPPEIRVQAVKRVTKNFNSKNNCDSRTYLYLLPTFAFCPVEQTVSEDYRMDAATGEKVNQVLGQFVGSHFYHNYTSGK